MALLPTTDSRLFLPRLWLAFVCKIDEWMNCVSIFINCLCFISLSRFVMTLLVCCVLLLSVLFLLVGLWWPSFQQQIRAIFLPRSWLAFVCKIDEWMNYVSMFINCLCFISLCRFVMALVCCVLLLSVLFLLVGLWWPSFQQQIRAIFLPRLCVRLMSEWIMWVCL